jgi:spermidine synthase
MSPIYWAIFFVSAATLTFEIALTRIFSEAQGYHFAFMAVSLALLGFGASGTALAVFPKLLRRDLPSSLFRYSLLFSLSLPVCYLISNYIPFDSYQITWDRRQILYLAIYYLSLAVPFFLAGLTIGAPLALLVGQESRIYFFNLAGSGLGCIVALVSLSLWGGEGTVVLASLGGALAALTQGRSQRRVAFSLLLLGVGLLILLRPPDYFTIKMSPYKTLSNSLRYKGAELLLRRWNAFSRVDVVKGPGVHAAPGLSPSYFGPLPTQLGITTDGDNLQPLTSATPDTDLSFLDSLPVSLPYLLLTEPRVLILEPGGGLDLLVALRKGAQKVVAVEANPLVTYVVRDLYGGFAGGIFQDPRVKVVNEIGRSYLKRTDANFDLFQLSLSDSFRPVTSGAYSLHENYAYTKEAFMEYWEHLSPQGIVMVHRWLQIPPSEGLRALALAVTALEGAGVDPVQHIAALRSFSTMLLLVKRSQFTPREIEEIKEFASERHLDLVYYPDMPIEEANKIYVLKKPEYYLACQELLRAQDKAEFYRAYPFDVSPPSDDRPFFFHFFTWKQIPAILESLGKIWQPFGGSGYLVLWALLILALLASLVLIILPLSFLREMGGGGTRGRVFLYFFLLGIGYLFVEIPLIQRFILFLGHPVYALGAVLFALLTFSGLGSLSSPRLPLGRGILLLGAMIVLYPPLLPLLFRSLLGLGLGGRLLSSILILAPLGFLMGLPFPKGIAVTSRLAPGLIPWAWGINGCASVLSSILASMGALTFGFSWVLACAGGAYLVGLVVFYPLIGGTKEANS